MLEQMMPRLPTTQKTPDIDLSALPLERIDVRKPRLYQDDGRYPLFERLRKEFPVHYCAESAYRPYWSLSRYKDVVECEMDTQTFSSVSNSVQTEDKLLDKRFLNFLGMVRAGWSESDDGAYSRTYPTRPGQAAAAGSSTGLSAYRSN
jgi:cytochrome P450